MLILISIKSELQPKSLALMIENNINPKVLTLGKEFIMCCLKDVLHLSTDVKKKKKKITLYFQNAVLFCKCIELNELIESLWLPGFYIHMYSICTILLVTIQEVND